MMKKFFAMALTVILAFCLAACNRTPANGDAVDLIIGSTATSDPSSTAPGGTSVTPAPTRTPRPTQGSHTLPEVTMKDGWPAEGWFAKIPPYRHGGTIGQPWADTYNISGASLSDWQAYCADLEAAGYKKTGDLSQGLIKIYQYANEEKNLGVNVGFWPEYPEIELYVYTLDGSVDYSDKPTIKVNWKSLDYLKLVPEYKEGGRIIKTHSWRPPDMVQDGVEIAQANISSYNAYKAKLEAAGFAAGEKSDWHTESYFYTNPSMPAIRVELYYDLNGKTTDNIVIGIVVFPNTDA